MVMKWKWLDWIILLLSISLVAVSIVWSFQGGSSESLVYLRSAEGEWYYPLDEDRILQLKGPLGITEVHVEGEEVWVEHSPCEFQTCVSHPPLSNEGDWNACLPNQVFLSLEGAETADVDDQTF